MSVDLCGEITVPPFTGLSTLTWPGPSARTTASTSCPRRIFARRSSKSLLRLALRACTLSLRIPMPEQAARGKHHAGILERRCSDDCCGCVEYSQCTRVHRQVGSDDSSGGCRVTG